MPQIITPFYIPAGGATDQVRPQQGMTKGKIKLVCITGGPVFMFEDDVSPATAARRVTGAANGNEVDFDLAATATGTSEVLKEDFPSLMTLYSAAETVGFVQFSDDSK